MTELAGQSQAQKLRLKSQIPASIKSSLSSEQLAALIDALVQPKAEHLFALRTSVRFWRGRHYVTLLLGREKRNEDRLRQEGQLDLKEVSLVTCLLGAGLIIYGIIPVLLILYLVKSAFGIDLFDGPSPLHILLCN